MSEYVCVICGREGHTANDYDRPDWCRQIEGLKDELAGRYSVEFFGVAPSGWDAAMRDPTFVASLHDGLADLDMGRTVSWDAVKARLDAPSAPGDSLDVETLARALEQTYPFDRHSTFEADAAKVAAEYERFRSEPTGATE